MQISSNSIGCNELEMLPFKSHWNFYNVQCITIDVIMIEKLKENGKK